MQKNYNKKEDNKAVNTITINRHWKTKTKLQRLIFMASVNLKCLFLYIYTQFFENFLVFLVVIDWREKNISFVLIKNIKIIFLYKKGDIASRQTLFTKMFQNIKFHIIVLYSKGYYISLFYCIKIFLWCLWKLIIISFPKI